jgi:hypothetical protein
MPSVRDGIGATVELVEADEGENRGTRIRNLIFITYSVSINLIQFINV